jgi:CheY-like chemotaxis protein
MNKPHALKILVVDDEEIVRYTLEKLINHLGHHCYCVADGLVGLRSMESDDYDAAIVDIRMPGLDGFAFLDRARTIRPGMPVVIVSGHASDETMEEVMQAGAFAFLPKPFRLNDIGRLLEKIRPSPDA